MYNEEQALRKISNAKKKQIVIVIMIISFLLIIGLGVGLYLYLDSRPLVGIPMVTLSNDEWTSEDVILTVEDKNGNIESYSFDCGNSFQSSPKYVVSENGEVCVQVTDINGRLSKKNIIYVDNIDRNPPTMVFENQTVVQLNSKFSVRTGVQVSDKESGLSNDYTVTPSEIDTNSEGEYVLTYSAFDKAGNFIEKSRTIVIKDITGRTYYRYRTGQIESYQCEPYLCKCVKSTSAASTGSCPTGYSLDSNGQCCQECFKVCKQTVWGEWSDWQQEKVAANATTEVETMIKED